MDRTVIITYRDAGAKEEFAYRGLSLTGGFVTILLEEGGIKMINSDRISEVDLHHASPDEFQSLVD